MQNIFQAKTLIFSLGLILFSCQEPATNSGGGEKGSIDSRDTVDGSNSSCPSGFIPIEGSGVLGTLDFCVMKFEAKSVNDIVKSVPEGFPDEGDYPELTTAYIAWDKCKSITESGFHGAFSLISNSEWMTIARNIESVATNWSGGVVGSGHLPRGNSDDNVEGGHDADGQDMPVSDINDPYSDTGNNSTETPGSGWEQKRTHILTNGEVIWDLAGNSYEYVDWDSSDDKYTRGPNEDTAGMLEFTVEQTGDLKDDDFRPLGDYTSANSIGQWFAESGGIVTRGGTSLSDTRAGVFNLMIGGWSATGSAYRCVYRH